MIFTYDCTRDTQLHQSNLMPAKLITPVHYLRRYTTLFWGNSLKRSHMKAYTLCTQKCTWMCAHTWTHLLVGFGGRKGTHSHNHTHTHRYAYAHTHTNTHTDTHAQTCLVGSSSRKGTQPHNHTYRHTHTLMHTHIHTWTYLPREL
jgi:hypothetical protein